MRKVFVQNVREELYLTPPTLFGDARPLEPDYADLMDHIRRRGDGPDGDGEDDPGDGLYLTPPKPYDDRRGP